MQLPEAPIKIYMAANGPKMAELAGEIADGTVGWFHSLEYVRDVTMPALRRGAERAGRSLDGFDATVGFPAVVTRDDSGIDQAKGPRDDVRDRARLGAAVPRSVSAAGFGDVAEAIGERVRAGDLRGAVELVPDEMAAAMLMAGSAERIRAKISAYREAGISRVHLLPSPPAATTRCTRGTSRSSRSPSCPSSTSRA